MLGRTRHWSLVCLILVIAASCLRAQEPAPKADVAAPELKVTTEQLPGLRWRCIGPANMSGRITALSVFEADPTTWYAATASGGLLKTVNNGNTFEHQFDREGVVSIGDVAVAPSNRDIVYLGSGENNPRNSVSYGDGVYKSTDGGKKWQNVGLKKSFQIGRIAVHPLNPDIVYVGALGRLYGPNEERGLYKTTDGGQTWERVLFIDDRTGVIDVQMNPKDPDTLLVATFERQRDGYDSNDPAKKWGPGSGLHKTTDGGKTWKKLTKGLPTCLLGRIGIDYYRKDPNIVFAIVDSEKIGTGPIPATAGPYMGFTGKDGDGGALLESVVRNGPADKADLEAGDLITKVNDKVIKTYRDLTDVLRASKVGDKLKVTRQRDKESKEVEVTLEARGGARPYLDRLGGQDANVQDKQGADGVQAGGIYKSTDGGDSWERINSLNPRPMYFSCIRVDPSDVRRLYVGGISLYRSQDGGRTFTNDAGSGTHADHHALWIDPRDGRHMILGNDGGVYVTHDRTQNWDHLNTTALGQFYHVAVDSRPFYKAYGGLQDNGSWGGPTRTRGPLGPINEDWVFVNGGDGYTCRVDPKDPDLVYFTSQWGRMGRRNYRTRELVRFQPPTIKGGELRFNWNTPYIVSAHESKNFYAAGNYVLHSADRGKGLKVISPEITATKKGSATALAESPKNAQLLYVGTDDGYLWVTRDGGKEWKNITKHVGLPGLRHVSSIEPSRYVEGRVYVVFDAHRSDEEKPYVLVSQDFGQTWQPLHGGLPQWGTTRVLREDIVNPNLLYLGTEFCCFCSLDRGQSWVKINNNLPTVAIHEFAQHPTAGEIVAATHGRSLWVLDVSALRQVTPETLTKSTLFAPPQVVRWQPDPSRGRTNRRFIGTNPPLASFFCTIAEKADKVSLKIVGADGKTVETLKVDPKAGLHRIDWDLERPGRLVQGRRGPRTAVPVGSYRLVLDVDGKELTQPLEIKSDPTVPRGVVVEDEEQR